MNTKILSKETVQYLADYTEIDGHVEQVNWDKLVESHEALREKMQAYSDGITWQTECLKCADLMNKLYEVDGRAESIKHAMYRWRDLARQYMKTLSDMLEGPVSSDEVLEKLRSERDNWKLVSETNAKTCSTLRDEIERLQETIKQEQRRKDEIRHQRDVYIGLLSSRPILYSENNVGGAYDSLYDWYDEIAKAVPGRGKP